MDVIKFGKKLSELIAEDIRNINNGGCGFFAYYVGLLLLRESIPFKLFVMRDDSRTLDIIRKNLRAANEGKSFEKGLLSVGHVMIQTEKVVFDAEGGFADAEHLPYMQWGLIPMGHITMCELSDMLKYGRWNTDYDKSQNMRLKKHILEAHTIVTNLKLKHEKVNHELAGAH